MYKKLNNKNKVLLRSKRVALDTKFPDPEPVGINTIVST